MNCRLLYVALIVSSAAYGQVGGLHAYQFLNVPVNGRLAALGGINVSLIHDINFFQSNPALLTDSMHNGLSGSVRTMPADISMTSVSYVYDFEKAGTIGFGVHHIGYGSIQGYDPAGVETAEFRSGEVALVAGKSFQRDNYKLGVNVKGIFSAIAGYRSEAVALDLGGAFVHPDHQLVVGMAIKNLGLVLSRYTESGRATLPLDVQLGVTFKPEYMPLRFSVTGYNLTRSSIAYYNPDDGTSAPGTLDKVMRHFNLAVEVLLHRNVNILAGYNFLTHKELKLETTGGGAGLSIGVAIRIRSFEFIASRSSYVIGSSGYVFTLSYDFKNLLKRSQ